MKIEDPDGVSRAILKLRQTLGRPDWLIGIGLRTNDNKPALALFVKEKLSSTYIASEIPRSVDNYGVDIVYRFIR